jgi:hypothetical protein
MTHREFLTWLQPRLERAAASGLDAEVLREVRDTLERMREAGALQPFASKLLNLANARATFDAAMVAELAREARVELAPPRERTAVFGVMPGGDED